MEHGENSAVVKSIKCLHSLYISGLLGSISRRREGKEGCYLYKTHDVPASCLCLDSDGPGFLGVFEWVAVRWWLGLESLEGSTGLNVQDGFFISMFGT